MVMMLICNMRAM